MQKNKIKPIKHITSAYVAACAVTAGLLLFNPAPLKTAFAGTTVDSSLKQLSEIDDISGSLCYANVKSYVNIRKEPSISSSVIGRINGGEVATVISENGQFIEIEYGKLHGYAVKGYFLFREDAKEVVAEKCKSKIICNVGILNIRAGASTSYSILGTFAKGDEAEFICFDGDFAKISFTKNGKSKIGYVYSGYIRISNEPLKSELSEEEKIRLQYEQEAKKQAEAAKKAAEEKKAEEKKQAEEAKKQQEAIKDSFSTGSNSIAQKVVDYAMQALGTKYVWGGTDIKKGVDCSGLCYASYKYFGYVLPRTSKSMSASSSLKSITPNEANLIPGDLIFYASKGVVDHVAMYIGNGLIIHSSSYDTGVIISQYRYRTPYNAKRVIY